MIFSFIWFSNDSFSHSDGNCDSCPRAFHETLGVKRPTEETYNKYLPFFLEDIPDPNCAKAGKAAYSNVRRGQSTEISKKFVGLLTNWKKTKFLKQIKSKNEKNYVFLFTSGGSNKRKCDKCIFHELSHNSQRIVWFLHIPSRSQKTWRWCWKYDETTWRISEIFPVQVCKKGLWHFFEKKKHLAWFIKIL